MTKANSPGLVLEGGAFRGLYTDGVLDALMDAGLWFRYIIGVSAGISNGYSYASGQRGRNLEIIEKYVRDGRYFGAANLLRCKSLFGLDFVFGEIPERLIPFDYDALSRFDGTVLAGVTNADTGSAEFHMYDGDRSLALLRATCAIPLAFPVISFNGGRYFDGGLADPIPIKKAVSDGCGKNLIVLTRPEGYRKAPSVRQAKLIGRKYPALAPVLANRHQVYNDSLDFCRKLEDENKAVVLRPGEAVCVDRFCRDVSALRRLYQAGYDDAMAKKDEISALFEQDTTTK